MKIININKEQFLNLLLNTSPFSQGQFGIITLVNNKLYKIYYKDFIETYLSRNASKLDSEVDSWLEIENNTNFDLLNPYKRIETLNRLSKTKSNNLITGVLVYKDLLVGIEMNYFKSYITLAEFSKIVSNSELNEYLKNCLDLIVDLLSQDIVPRDIKEDNILVNLQNRQIVLIDLDGSETIYGPKNYVSEFPYNKRYVFKRFEEMKNRLKRRN